ncbi:universal stress protein [Streptomyces sp. NPDC086010]|uniref:universal stress protein n=1 Tax=Streptomyces sp. NPDC086010 TaxID=3365745 RepID=UPI0037D5F24B
MSRIVTAGIDGSQESIAAAAWAAEEAAVRKCPLRLVHVWNDGTTSSGAGPSDPEAQRRSAEALLHQAADHVRLIRPDMQIEAQQVAGSPVDELSGESRRSELLVLGSRGLGGVKGFIAGSVSLAVLRCVRCPLVLVRAGPPEDTAPIRPPGEVVLGLDLPDPSPEVLSFAFAAADRYRCGLDVVHSWSLPPVYGPGSTDVIPTLMAQTAAERRRELVTALAPWTEEYPHVPVRRECLQGHPAQDLVDASDQASLVVVGLRHRSTRLGGHVGPVIHSVLHHTASPVAVVPHD